MSDVRTPRIVPGEIKIGGGAYPLAYHADFQVWEIDCASKRFDCWISSNDDDITVTLVATGETLYGDPDRFDEPTLIVFDTAGRDWQVMAEAARYTARVCLWVGNVPDPDDAGDH